MYYGRWTAGLAALAIALAGPSGGADARGDIVLAGSFGPNGDLGFATSPPSLGASFGAATGMGAIYQMDGFVNVPGVDFGAGPGMSADLANGAPAGLGFTFAASQPSSNQMLLSYTFVNNSLAAMVGFQFLQYTDADIGPNYTDESAKVKGADRLAGPTSYQVGDPSLSTIFTNIGAGTLSNGNDFPSFSKAGDVSIALGFTEGMLGIGQSITFDVLLSDNGTSLSNLSVTQNDPIYTGDSLTISGIFAPSLVPEPSSLILLAVGSLMGLGHLARSKARAQAWTRSQ